MRKIFLSSLFFFIILAGCSNDEAYNNAIQKGLDNLASEEYQKAEGAFELALDEKKNDEKATALLKQTIYYQDALKAMNEGKLDVAKEKAEKVIALEAGSAALIKKSEKLVSSTKEFETTLTEVIKDYEAALKEFEDKKYKEANKLLDKLSKKVLDQPIFKQVKKKVGKLEKDVESALANDEKSKQEKVGKEQAEASVFSEAEARRIVEKSEGLDENTGIALSSEPEYENGRPYYSGRLYSKEMQVDGGTGTLLLFKVFEDGLVPADGYRD